MRKPQIIDEEHYEILIIDSEGFEHKRHVQARINDERMTLVDWRSGYIFAVSFKTFQEVEGKFFIEDLSFSKGNLEELKRDGFIDIYPV